MSSVTVPEMYHSQNLIYNRADSSELISDYTKNLDTKENSLSSRVIFLTASDNWLTSPVTIDKEDAPIIRKFSFQNGITSSVIHNSAIHLKKRNDNFVKNCYTNNTNNKYGKVEAFFAYNGIKTDGFKSLLEESCMKTYIKKELKVVYGALSALGISSLSLASISKFIIPIFDPNVADVLFPMSVGFIMMVLLDYALRGREH